jgi:hypothetical protein
MKDLWDKIVDFLEDVLIPKPEPIPIPIERDNKK